MYYQLTSSFFWKITIIFYPIMGYTKKNDVIRLDVIEKYFKEHYVAA